ncbi:MAG: class I SAM-dependent methyltransferase, partial [Deltaproteobacteria bacterium]|nr:class I SAM-dependent methyltransferase [Deltaproteobacteria bacterium]
MAAPSMADYYARKLSARRLQLVYDIAPARVKRYLQAEIDFVLARIAAWHVVLELGCGYGRVLQPLAQKAKSVCGIDTSRESLQLAR